MVNCQRPKYPSSLLVVPSARFGGGKPLTIHLWEKLIKMSYNQLAYVAVGARLPQSWGSPGLSSDGTRSRACTEGCARPCSSATSTTTINNSQHQGLSFRIYINLYGGVCIYIYMCVHVYTMYRRRLIRVHLTLYFTKCLG